ncbi:MAG: hypothetical protein JWN14_4167 [Chthonomonadales bacterium]|nr:hypothetical protein [Chthonomonadales bacterium]
MQNRNRWSVGLVLIGVAACTAGCGGPVSYSPNMADSNKQVASHAGGGSMASEKAASNVGLAAPQASKTEESPKLTLAKYQQSEPDRYLIKNATMTVETADVRGGAKQLAELAKSLKGYVSDSHESVDGIGSRSVTMTARVPYQEFENATQRLEGLGKVQDKQVTAEDVTEEFVDTTARTTNLKKSEARLLDHLSHTAKLSDTLAIETELTRVREEVEKLDGRLRFLAHRISYSTLNVTFRESAHAQTVTPPETFSSGKIATDAGRSLIGFLQGVWSNVIWLGIWAIVWLPPVVLFVWFLRREIRRNRRPVVPSPPPPYDVHA